jgi:hypothetical protein
VLLATAVAVEAPPAPPLPSLLDVLDPATRIPRASIGHGGGCAHPGFSIRKIEVPRWP